MDADGSNERRFTFNDYRDRNPSFSPDGQVLVWDSMPVADTDGHLRAIDISQNDQVPGPIVDLTPYVPLGIMDARPGFSPDGTEMSFSSNRHSSPVDLGNWSTTDFEIYVDFTFDSEDMSLTNIQQITQNPSWSHQSDWGPTNQAVDQFSLGRLIPD